VEASSVNRRHTVRAISLRSAANFDQLDSERLDLGEDAVERCLVGQRSR
jgi:hypothetical protein